MKLRGKVAIVTGGAGGIGRAIAIAFAKEGANIAIADLDEREGKIAVEEILAMGGKAIAIHTDVSQSKSVRKMVETVCSEYRKLDILVNNAGVIIRQPFLDISEENWTQTLNINLKGPFLCTQQAARRMVENGGGVVINISSTAQEIARFNQTAYAVSKGGVKILTMVTALELAQYNIRVNAIAPHIIQTRFTSQIFRELTSVKKEITRIPLGRLGKPEDLTGAAIFLASDESNWITGTTIFVDGGFLIFG